MINRWLVTWYFVTWPAAGLVLVATYPLPPSRSTVLRNSAVDPSVSVPPGCPLWPW